MSPKYLLDHSLKAFAGELLAFVQRANDSVNALKRTVEQRPSAGVQDFKECLDDLEQQVSDFTEEIQQLAACTADTTSLEELIGHCTAVYHANRTTALQLEQHLSQYGYQRPAGAVLEPEHPDEPTQHDSLLHLGRYSAGTETVEALKAVLGRTSCSTAAGKLNTLCSMQRQAYSTPTSPVSKTSTGACTFVGDHAPSRLGSSSQPGSPTVGYRGPSAGRWGPGAAAVPVLGDVGPVNAGPPATQLQPHERSSVGTSSSTPPGLLMSPGVAALANKYATSSVGGSSVGGLSMASSRPSTGPGTKQRPVGRDLSLAYGSQDTQSPDLPIFGHTAAHHSQQQPMQQQDWSAVARDATALPSSNADQVTPDGTAATAAWTPGRSKAGAAAAAAAGSDDEDTTGQLYSSLIHSNMDGMSSRDVDAQEDQAAEPVTPRAGASCPGTPKAPGTAGRLPAQWHSKRMQELDSLQADLTNTLSQMKRTPSRSRLASRAASPEDSEEEREQQQQQQQRRPVQALGRSAGSSAEEASHQSLTGQAAVEMQQSDAAAAAAAADMQPPPSAGGTALQRLRQRLQEQQQIRQQQQQLHGAAAAPAPTAGKVGRHSSAVTSASAAAAASTSVTAAAAAAAAAKADLEGLMEGLSKKYADDAAAAAAADKQEERAVLPAAADTCGETTTYAAGAAAAAAQAAAAAEDSDSLSAKYAALAMSAEPSATDLAEPDALQQQPSQQQQQQGCGAPLLAPPAPSSSPEQQRRRWEGASIPARSSTAGAAAAGARPSALMTGSVASDASGLSTPGKPRLAAAIAAWHTAVRMDCPSPLSPQSPAAPGAAMPGPMLRCVSGGRAGMGAGLHGSTDAAAAVGAQHTPPAITAATGPAGMEDAADGLHAAGGGAGADEQQQQQQAAVLTPAVQPATRYAVAAVGVNSVRPMSSARQPQHTTDMERLEEVRGCWHNVQQQQQQQQRGLPSAQQQQQRLVQNLEMRLAGVAEAQEGSSETAATTAAGSSWLHAAASAVGVLRQPSDKTQAAAIVGSSLTAAVAAAGKEQQQAGGQYSVRSGSSNSSAGSSDARKGKQSVSSPDVQLKDMQQELTPRAARLLRRQQQNSQEQQHQQGCISKAPSSSAATASSSVLRALENIGVSSSSAGGSAQKEQQQHAAGAVQVQVQPGWQAQPHVVRGLHSSRLGAAGAQQQQEQDHRQLPAQAAPGEPAALHSRQNCVQTGRRARQRQQRRGSTVRQAAVKRKKHSDPAA
ncbi:hypothetical protein COO60DRAFT_870826 [Scenedesmus sp. NREL 46B-D3]|nr:hypothetical protein COO60DRAFT_870826 [Scenedesmus sp. NREL 46B-D3]